MNEKELLEIIKEITERGNTVEIVRNENGNMIIYEVKRELLTEIPNEAQDE